MAPATPRPPRRLAAPGLVAAATALAGCGSAAVAELPPPARPPASPVTTARPPGSVVPRAGAAAATQAGRTVRLDDGTTEARVLPRAREVELVDRRTGRRLSVAPAGVAPAQAAAHDRWLWVTDTRGSALLVFRTRPKLALVRRVFLPGAPWAITLDPVVLRLWVTLPATNEVAELPAHGRPHELRRFPTVRQPDAVAVDPAAHVVTITSPSEVQRFTPPPLP